MPSHSLIESQPPIIMVTGIQAAESLRSRSC